MQFGRLVFAIGAAILTPIVSVQISLAGSTEKPTIYGEWIPPDKDAVIRIEPCQGDAQSLCARLVKHAYVSLSQTDALNPDPELRNRDLIGVSILDGVSSVSSQRWKGGALYDPRTGKSYYAKVQLTGEDEIKITGCIGPGLCKGYRWQRYQQGQSLSTGEVVGEAAQSRTAQISIEADSATKM